MPITLKPKGGTSKPATRKTATVKAKPAAKQSSNGNGRTAKVVAPPPSDKQRKSSGQRRNAQRSGVSQSVLNKHIKKLSGDREKVEKYTEQRDDAIDQRFADIIEALNEGVGITLIQESVDVSRQNLYKGLANRGYNSDGSNMAGKEAGQLRRDFDKRLAGEKVAKRTPAKASTAKASAKTNGKPTASRSRGTAKAKPAAKGRAKIRIGRR